MHKLALSSIFFGILIAIGTVGTGIGCKVTQTMDSQSSIDSIDVPHLLALPQNFQDKVIRVRGYYIRGFEESGMFASYELYRSGERQPGIWIRDENSLFQNVPPAFIGCVEVVGRFHFERNRGLGHMRGWFAAIEKPSEFHVIKILEMRQAN